MGHRFEPCRGHLNIGKRLAYKSLFYFSKKELTLNGSLSTVVGDEKLTSREDLIGLLFFYVQNDEDTFLKVDEVSKTEAQTFDVFDKLIGPLQFCI